MAVTQTTVTGPIYIPNLTKPENAKIVFELSSWDREEGEATFVTGPFVGAIDENGDFSVNLFTTTEGTNQAVYHVSVIYLTMTGKYTRECLGTVAFAGPGPYNLSDLNFVDPDTTASFDLLAEVRAYAMEARQTQDLVPRKVFDVASYIQLLDAAQLDAVLAEDTDAQDASVILQAVHNAGDACLAWLQEEDERHATLKFPEGTMVASDEFLSDTFYTAMINQTNLGNRKRLLFDGNGCQIRMVNTNGATRQGRPDGILASVRNYRALFPLHLPASNRIYIDFKNFSIYGNNSAENDMVGFWGWNMLNHQFSDNYFENTLSTALLIEGAFNLEFNDNEIQSCGFQPLSTPQVGTNLPNEMTRTVRFTLRFDSGNDYICTANEDVFHTDQTSGTGDYLTILDTRWAETTPNSRIFRIGTVTDARTATIQALSPTAIHRDVTDQFGTFSGMRGSMSLAAPTTLNLRHPLAYATQQSLIGRYVYVCGAGSADDSNLNVLCARITALSGDGKTLTLSHGCSRDAADAAVIMNPSHAFARSGDQIAFSGNTSIQDDIKYSGGRITNADGFSDGKATAVCGVFQAWNLGAITNSKTHGMPPVRNGWGGCMYNTVFDSCSINVIGHQFTHGCNLPFAGQILITGSGSANRFSGCDVSQFDTHDWERIFHFDARDDENSRSQLSFDQLQLEASETSRFPTDNQQIVTFGPETTRPQVKSGYVLSANSDIELDPFSALTNIELDNQVQASMVLASTDNIHYSNRWLTNTGSWAGINADLSNSPNGGLALNAQATNFFGVRSTSAIPSFSGSVNPVIVVRIRRDTKRVSGNFVARLRWANATHSANAGPFEEFTFGREPEVGETVTLVYNLRGSDNYADWISSDITQLQLDLHLGGSLPAERVGDLVIDSFEVRGFVESAS